MIDYGPGEVLRSKKFKHQYSSDSREWMVLAHPDKSLVGVFLLLGFEKLDGTGERIDVNNFLRSCGWDNSKGLLPVGTEVDYRLTEEFGDDRLSCGVNQYLRATVSNHVEGWYELTLLADGSKVLARPSHVHHESEDSAS